MREIRDPDPQKEIAGYAVYAFFQKSPGRRGERKTSSIVFFYLLVGIVVFLDQLSKFLALHYLSLHHSVEIFPGILDFTLLKNSGIAFGLMSGYEPVLFTVITLSLIILFWVSNRSQQTSRLNRWALSLILGGALGNWIDRLRFQAVIDFIDFRVWPVFNLADSAITIGVGLYMIGLLTAKEDPKRPS